MGERVLDADRRELGTRSAAERATAGSEDDLAHVGSGAGAQALVHGAVFGVDGDDLGSRRRPRPLHHGATGDERLLVGQGQSSARAQRGECHRQAGEAHDAVHDDVGLSGDGGQCAGARRHVDARGHAGAQVGHHRLVGDGDASRPQSLRLLGQRLDRSCGTECHHLVTIGLGIDDLDRLRPDRPRRSDDGDRDTAHLRLNRAPSSGKALLGRAVISCCQPRGPPTAACAAGRTHVNFRTFTR